MNLIKLKSLDFAMAVLAGASPSCPVANSVLDQREECRSGFGPGTFTLFNLN